jgi:mono/diheme cytochrome c family protein
LEGLNVKRVLKVLALIVGGLVCLAAAGMGYMVARKPAMAPPADVKVAMTPERIARGQYIFELSDCDGCHSGRDFTRFGGPVIPGQRGQGVEFPKEMGMPGRIASRNITMDRETGIGAWTDGEKIRAIREGISRDGRQLFPMMPYARFRHMSDEDVYSLVAFLNTLPPVQHKVQPSEVDFPVSVLMKSAAQPAGHVPEPNHTEQLTHGEYLVTMAGCAECHTQSEKGQPKPGMMLAGGERFAFPGATVVSANITPDPQSGIGRWSEKDFVDRFHQYREYADKGSPSSGPENFTVMPWLLFSKLPEGDLRAIYAFLRTQKPVYHPVDSHPDPKLMTKSAK